METSKSGSGVEDEIHVCKISKFVETNTFTYIGKIDTINYNNITISFYFKINYVL